MKTTIPAVRLPARARPHNLPGKFGQPFDARLAHEDQNFLRLKSIMVPTDFSATAGPALDRAVSVARQFGSTLHLLHVVDPAATFINTKPPFSEQDKQAVRAARERLDKLARDQVDDLIPVKVAVSAGRAYQKICESARKLKIDLIALSTHGLTGLKHLLLGSTAERVVRHAPCSVLVVPGRSLSATSDFKPKKILLPTDFSPASNAALKYAEGLARKYHGQIHLLYVVPIYYPAAEEMTPDLLLLEEDLKTAGRKDLARLNRSLQSKGLSVKTEMRLGRPATQITEAIKDLECDLVVISTQGRTGWARALLGSTTEEVVRHASCPVLVVRRPALKMP